jgi:hypothetical protein
MDIRTDRVRTRRSPALPKKFSLGTLPNQREIITASKCEHPSEADRLWFPGTTETDWLKNLEFRHARYLKRPLSGQTGEVLKHVARLWGFDVILETVDAQNKLINTQECKIEKRKKTPR